MACIVYEGNTYIIGDNNIWHLDNDHKRRVVAQFTKDMLDKNPSYNAAAVQEEFSRIYDTQVGGMTIKSLNNRVAYFDNGEAFDFNTLSFRKPLPSDYILESMEPFPFRTNIQCFNRLREICGDSILYIMRMMEIHIRGGDLSMFVTDTYDPRIVSAMDAVGIPFFLENDVQFIAGATAYLIYKVDCSSVSEVIKFDMQADIDDDELKKCITEVFSMVIRIISDISKASRQ